MQRKEPPLITFDVVNNRMLIDMGADAPNNTVKYRAEKALELLGIDKNNHGDRFSLSLAVFIHRLEL